MFPELQRTLTVLFNVALISHAQCIRLRPHANLLSNGGTCAAILTKDIILPQRKACQAHATHPAHCRLVKFITQSVSTQQLQTHF